MNQYMLLRRMIWPIMLLIFGVTAILNQYTSIGYDKSWPLYIIAWGVLKLAENAILAQSPPAPPPPYPGYPPGYPSAGPGTGPGTGVPGPGIAGTPVPPGDSAGFGSSGQEGH